MKHYLIVIMQGMHVIQFQYEDLESASTALWDLEKLLVANLGIPAILMLQEVRFMSHCVQGYYLSQKPHHSTEIPKQLLKEIQDRGDDIRDADWWKENDNGDEE